MSFKCSLLGHNYGDTERRHNREENGSELVETTRELKTCTRCGETLVISEATEVKTLRTADAGGGEADADRQDGVDDRQVTGAGQQNGTGARPRDGTGIDRSEDGPARGQTGAETTGRRDGQSTAGGREEQITQISTRDTGRGDAPRGGEHTPQNRTATGAEAVGQDEPDSGVEPSDADAMDRSGSSGSDAAAPGSAGDTSTVDTADTRSRRDEDTEDTPLSRKNDAFIIDEDGEERRPTEWPGPEGEGGDDTGDVEDWEPDVDTDGPDTRPESAARSTAGLTVPEGEFYCPECEFTTLVEFASSLREGDFCPDCHRAALEHRSE